MKKTFITFAFLIAVTALAASGVSAQITINIPGLKKIIKKPAITNVETTVQDNSDPATRTNPTTVHGNASGSTNWWIDYQIEAITKYKQQIDQWDRETQVFPKPGSSDDYIGLAFSKKERASWLRDKKVAPDARLDAALDELKASLTHRMPEYTIHHQPEIVHAQECGGGEADACSDDGRARDEGVQDRIQPAGMADR